MADSTLPMGKLLIVEFLISVGREVYDEKRMGRPWPDLIVPRYGQYLRAAGVPGNTTYFVPA